MERLNRREMLGLSAAGAVAAYTPFVQGCASNRKGRKMSDSRPAYQRYSNSDFYKPDGSFDETKARQAYYEMMEYFNYPIVDRLKSEEFWAIDFGLGRFWDVGMGGIFWVNDKKGNYFGHEIFLLPGQRIPEHAHVETEVADPKMEAWQPRNGKIYVYGQGEPTPGVEEDIPKEDRPYWVAKTRKKLLPGEVATLDEAGSKHWMMAGKKGAIVTEYATYHDDDGLRFSNPNMVF